MPSPGENEPEALISDRAMQMHGGAGETLPPGVKPQPVIEHRREAPAALGPAPQTPAPSPSGSQRGSGAIAGGCLQPKAGWGAGGGSREVALPKAPGASSARQPSLAKKRLLSTSARASVAAGSCRSRLPAGEGAHRPPPPPPLGFSLRVAPLPAGPPCSKAPAPALSRIAAAFPGQASPRPSPQPTRPFPWLPSPGAPAAPLGPPGTHI